MHQSVRYTVQDGSEHHLDRFDEVVHAQLTGTVMNVVGTGAPSLRYVLAVLTVPGLGILPQCIHLGRVGIVVDIVESKEEAFWQWILVAVHLPSVVFFVFWSTMLGWKIGTSLVKRLKIWIVVPLIFLLQALLGAFFRVSFMSLRFRFGVITSVACWWILVLCAYSWTYRHFFIKAFNSL